MRKMIVDRLKELMQSGAADRALGWAPGEFGYDVTPRVFTSPEDIEKNFTYSAFCGANLSKYLVKEANASDKAVAVILKPCDSYSFNQLLTEHRFKREKVYAIGVSCSGTVDIRKLRQIAGEGITAVKEDGDTLSVSTVYGDNPVTINIKDVLLERCLCCDKRCAAYDELIGEEKEKPKQTDRFSKVFELEALNAEQRYGFWQRELSRCIRCNACRDVCPACTCENCVFSDPGSGMENKAAANEFEEKLYHVIRAFHVAGRCTDCGECSRVCPESIPLHLLNRKFIKDINSFYGEYQAGETVGSRAPLVDFKAEDREP